MEAKKCQYCKAEIRGKRSDAKFCSNTCKAKHWKEKTPSLPEKEEKNVVIQLRIVLNGADNTTIISEADHAPKSIFKTMGILGIVVLFRNTVIKLSKNRWRQVKCFL